MNNGTQKNTPGPWTASANPGRQPTNWFVEKPMQGKDRFYLHIVAEIPNHSTQAEANARLIAAAPEMLKALKFIADALRDSPDFKEYATTSDGYQFHPLSLARAAIAKAEGEG
jgi:hypothetical protein